MRTLQYVVLLILGLGSVAHGNKEVSQCETTRGALLRISCPYQTLDVEGKRLTRTVKYALPDGEAPKKGWPAVVMYQGSFFKVDFTRYERMPFGGFNEMRLIQSLLDNGFAVIAPPAIEGLYWMTNLLALPYNGSEDDVFLQNLIGQIQGGAFGDIDSSKLFATGISSGGYNTSRMAVSYPGVFKALAIESASYATCGGPLCILPDEVPEHHPPTLFLHGESDHIVPISTMWKYYNFLKDAGVPTAAYTEPDAGHMWLEDSPAQVTNWFLKYKNARRR